MPPPPADKEANLECLKQAELDNLKNGAVAAGTMGVMRGGGKVLRKAVGRGAAAEGAAAKGTRCSVAPKGLPVPEPADLSKLGSVTDRGGLTKVACPHFMYQAL
jgi:hypothetical protein